jgi:hypothetical protein
MWMGDGRLPCMVMKRDHYTIAQDARQAVPAVGIEPSVPIVGRLASLPLLARTLVCNTACLLGWMQMRIKEFSYALCYLYC